MLALLLAALAVGLDNFAVSIGIGLSGVDARTRRRVVGIFGVFESGMPLIGLLLGNNIAHALGGGTRDFAGGLLVATGAWGLIQARRESREPGSGASAAPSTRLGRLMVTGLALSIDNLVVGFSLGVTKTPLLTAIIVFAAVSVGLSLIGLELGRRLGERVESSSELLAGVVLIVVGVLVATGVF
jgi:putative Mn2+ efflux pump MntP